MPKSKTKESILWNVFDRRDREKDHIGVIRAETKSDAKAKAVKKYGKYSDVKKMPWGQTWIYK